jgi:hypothetical protein
MHKARLLGESPALKLIECMGVNVQHVLNNEVAVKMLPAHASADTIEDFQREMQFMKVCCLVRGKFKLKSVHCRSWVITSIWYEHNSTMNTQMCTAKIAIHEMSTNRHFVELFVAYH